MSKTYINEPVTDAHRKSIEAADEFWTGPKLIALLAITLGSALLLLWAMANGHVGPHVNS